MISAKGGVFSEGVKLKRDLFSVNSSFKVIKLAVLMIGEGLWRFYYVFNTLHWHRKKWKVIELHLKYFSKIEEFISVHCSWGNLKPLNVVEAWKNLTVTRNSNPTAGWTQRLQKADPTDSHQNISESEIYQMVSNTRGPQEKSSQAPQSNPAIMYMWSTSATTGSSSQKPSNDVNMILCALSFCHLLLFFGRLIFLERSSEHWYPPSSFS